MVDAVIMIFDPDGASWEWEETLPAVPRVGETFCFDELQDYGDKVRTDVQCTVSEVQWRFADGFYLMIIADINNEEPGIEHDG